MANDDAPPKSAYELAMERLAAQDRAAGIEQRALSGEQKERIAELFRTKTRAEWCELMEGTDVCFAPVLSFVDAPKHPANVARDTYIEVDGVTQPAPAPRFSRTPSAVQHGGHDSGADTDAVLSAMGFGERELASLKESGAIS